MAATVSKPLHSLTVHRSFALLAIQNSTAGPHTGNPIQSTGKHLDQSSDTALVGEPSRVGQGLGLGPASDVPVSDSQAGRSSQYSLWLNSSPSMLTQSTSPLGQKPTPPRTPPARLHTTRSLPCPVSLPIQLFITSSFISPGPDGASTSVALNLALPYLPFLPFLMYSCGCSGPPARGRRGR